MNFVDADIFGSDHHCFGCAPKHSIGMKLRFARIDDAVFTQFVPGAEFEGPPGVMHGGLVATLADELASWTIKLSLRRLGFTTRFKGRLARAIRTGVVVEGSGRIVDDNPLLVTVDVRLVQASFEAFRGEFSLALQTRQSARALLGDTIPEGWNVLLPDEAD